MDNYILNDYFDWLCSIVDEGAKKPGRYGKLYSVLHSITFTYSNEFDEDRAEDGVELRWRYICDGGDSEIKEWEEDCTVLEFMIALAFKMQGIMESPDNPDYTVGRWVWVMIKTMKIDKMTNAKIDRRYVKERVECMLDKDYLPDGELGLFYVPDAYYDLRYENFWTQACWYMNSIS